MSVNPSPALSEAIVRRLESEGLSLSEWARRSKVSPTKLGALKSGVPPVTAPLRRRAEAALGWAPRSIEAILDGGQPTLLVQPATEEPPAAVTEVAFSAAPGVIEALRATEERLSKIEKLLQELAVGPRSNPLDPPEGSVPARTDAERARAKRRRVEP
jgi:hypothetical protein